MPFAPIHFTSGPVVVTWNAIQLGFSEDGARISVIPRYSEIPSDDFGGREGYPTDAQFMGAIASIQLPLTKYVKSVCDALSRFNAAGVVASPVAGNHGLLPPIGTFVRQDSLAASLLLDGVNEDITFATAFLRQNFEINSGTKWRTYMVGFECWMNQTDYQTLSQSQTRRLFTLS